MSDLKPTKRKKKSKNNICSIRKCVRLSPREWKMIETRINSIGLTISSYMRVCMGLPDEPARQLGMTIKTLKKIINQEIS